MRQPVKVIRLMPSFVGVECVEAETGRALVAMRMPEAFDFVTPDVVERHPHVVVENNPHPKDRNDRQRRRETTLKRVVSHGGCVRGPKGA